MAVKEKELNACPASTIVIVDDDQDILDTLTLFLRKQGYLVNAFNEGVTAFEHIRDHPSKNTIMLSDIRMPGISGLQLAKKVKQLNPNIKVILMTAFEIKTAEFEKVLPSIKIEGFIEKPFSLDELDALLQRLIIGDTSICNNNNNNSNSNESIQLSKEVLSIKREGEDIHNHEK